MNPQRWQQIKRVLESAMTLDPVEGAKFLDEACGNDHELRSEVESLLAAYVQAGTFIEGVADDVSGGLLGANEADTFPGRRVGAYKIIRQLGRGGMGSVYLGVRADDQYEKQVAIKLIGTGMDSEFVIQRFRTERQILANLDHPNIARLLDGGSTEDGLPYFVMEYVQGLPIDQYCEANNLSTVERLRMFRQVCRAVRFAHQNLIVHRDIKPANILVTPEGVPMLLDFGIAKLLDQAHAGDDTGTAMGMMTPEFASPEQVRGQPITTASDIYSLGVVLYLLLTGYQPYRIRNRAPEEILRIVCEEDPPRPSLAATGALEEETAGGAGRITARSADTAQARTEQQEKSRRRLDRDLDTIVMMAMRKEAARRYASVEQLSEEIRRYLEGLPIMARKDTFGYRARKFIGRHKVGVGAAALIAATLVAGLIAVAREAHIAGVQRAKAERRFEDVRKLADSYMFELHDKIQDLQGATPARELLVKRALEYLDSLEREVSDDAGLSRDLATAYQKVGDIQGRPGFPNLGDKAGALASYGKALAIREALTARGVHDSGLLGELGTSYERMGDVFRLTGDIRRALESYDKALAVRDSLLASDPGDFQTRAAVASSYDRVADALAMQGKVAQALDGARKSVALREQLSAEDANSAEIKRSLEIGYVKVGDMLTAGGDSSGAIESYRKAETAGSGLTHANPNNSRYRRELTVCYDKIGNALSRAHDPAGALDYYQRSLAIRAEMSSRDPRNAEAQRDLSVSYDKMGTALAALGKLQPALAYYKKALLNDEALSQADPQNAQARDDLSISLVEYADMQLRVGAAGSALDNIRKSLAIREELASADQTNTSLQVELAQAYSKMGDAYSALASNRKSGAPEVMSPMPQPAAPGGSIANWRQARAWYEKSQTLLSKMAQAGVLNGADASAVTEAAKQIARCDAVIARLQRRPPARQHPGRSGGPQLTRAADPSGKL